MVSASQNEPAVDCTDVDKSLAQAPEGAADEGATRVNVERRCSTASAMSEERIHAVEAVAHRIAERSAQRAG